MITESNLTIIIPLLFVILFQMLKLSRETPIHANIEEVENSAPGERPTVDYSTFKDENWVFKLTDFLPTLSRWAAGPTGIFGIFHMLISYYIILSGLFMLYLVRQGFEVAWIGIVGMAVLWILLPFFEVKEYSDLVKKGIRPRSIEWQIVGTFLMFLAIGIISRIYMFLGEIVVSLGYSQHKQILLILFYPVWSFHDLHFQKAYTALIHDEVKAAKEY